VARGPALEKVLDMSADTFTGSTVPASPMSVLKRRFSTFESNLPALWRILSRIGVERP
jgi:hypothetical protein